jgi:hypothetical protein
MNAATAPAADLPGPGFCRVAADDIRTWLGPGALDGWAEFAASWNSLDLDEYMADGGRYRRRRYACFTVAGGVASRQPHRPHYQSRGYNALNGGVDRWFAPVDERVGTHPVLLGLLAIFESRFANAAGTTSAAASWLVEMHQFRIEADPRHAGQPTPEGMHRDGVDWVAVTLVGRNNVAGGVTAVADETGRTLGSFMLESPLDTVLLDDHRVWHGVTPVRPFDPMAPAHRDVLVLTFRDQRAR